MVVSVKFFGNIWSNYVFMILYIMWFSWCYSYGSCRDTMCNYGMDVSCLRDMLSFLEVRGRIVTIKSFHVYHGTWSWLLYELKCVSASQFLYVLLVGEVSKTWAMPTTYVCKVNQGKNLFELKYIGAPRVSKNSCTFKVRKALHKRLSDSSHL